MGRPVRMSEDEFTLYTSAMSGLRSKSLFWTMLAMLTHFSMSKIV